VARRCYGLPEKHGGKDYWLSTDVLNGPESGLGPDGRAGAEVRATSSSRRPESMLASGTMPSSRTTPRGGRIHAAGVDGRMGYIGRCGRHAVRHRAASTTSASGRGEPAVLLKAMDK